MSGQVAAKGLGPPYKKPPIVEAIIAVHFTTPLAEKYIDRFAQRQKDQFPRSEQRLRVELHFDVATKQQRGRVDKDGYKLRSQNTAQLVIITPSQMGFVQLAPYTQWDELYKGARRQWDALKKVTDHIALSRVSTRFINRIDVPARSADKSIDLRKYFSAGLSLPTSLSSMALKAFNVSCSLVDEKNELMQVLKLAATPSPLIDFVSFLLDIDVYTTGPLPGREEDIWSLINTLQSRKNSLFESFITDDTRELFGGVG